MRELTHRSKNLLTVIQAIMRQTASNSTAIEDFVSRFTARLQSLAGSHDLLVQEDWQGASMRELVRSQLGHYSDREDPQIELSGGPMQIPPDAAQHIGMALHELATNAAKYGALSTPGGKVQISWQTSPATDATPMCQLTWEESGGPPVERPSRRGFGRVVLERTVARALQGEVSIDYAATGLRWSLEFPRSNLTGV
jgi:two-component sensor histidine kinase